MSNRAKHKEPVNSPLLYYTKKTTRQEECDMAKIR
jgi:hypothetical protein